MLTEPSVQLFGVDGETGGYALPPLSPADLARVARGEGTVPVPPRIDPVAGPEATAAFNGLVISRPDGGIDGPRRGRGDPSQARWNLAENGWGVVWSADDPRKEKIRRKLAPLLDLRRRQATRGSRCLFHDLEHRKDESFWQFQDRYGAEREEFNPRNLPRFLLLIGGPEAIPFDFQVQLARSYAVGRIDFAALDDFAHYAKAVVDAERSRKKHDRRVAVFAPEHPDDPLSQKSAEQLGGGLEKALRSAAGWKVEARIGREATKRRLTDLLAGPAPALLFTAGHGALFRSGDERQPDVQGALVCADWAGPKGGHMTAETYLAAADVPDRADLSSSIAFHFACCSLGVPAKNLLHQSVPAIPPDLAPRPMLARLPERLLAQGALAVIGHIDLAFATTFGNGKEPTLFTGCCRSLLEGLPVGAAVEGFRTRCVDRALELNDLRSSELGGTEVPPERISAVWMAYHDASHYAVLGDPAVRLPAAR
ncbi:MAG TPA: hypothetical protein VGS22_14745 [Thermoanaerobaculia bacterium]|jgi:hypothetical protein|nr:hypothetical protein [Thermoanaerobaculia bacterium]